MYKQPTSIAFAEFVALMAMLTALTALSTDAMLPALSEIGLDLGVERANDTQLVISLLFLGMAIGQFFYGPVSDSIGRKPTIYAGLGLFAVGSLLAMLTPSFQFMLIGRALQGLGTAAPRIVVIALIRDQYNGRLMARVMSFVTAVFILVPVVAPAVGQAILLFAHWRMIFAMFLILAVFIGSWFVWRQPETLAPDRRVVFSLRHIVRAVREVITHRRSFGYIVTIGLVSGAFLGYLSSAQQIFQKQYGLGHLFPLYFAVLSLSIGGASVVNARLVMRYGMRVLSFRALQGIVALSLFCLGGSAIMGEPPLWLLTLYFLVTFFGVGILFGNLNALAMEPLGHIAGVGAAVVGSFSTFLSLFLGTLIGQSYNGTVFPLVGGFTVFSILSIGIMYWVETK